MTRNRQIFLGLGIVLVTAVLLLLLGRLPWCECGTIKLWHGDVMSSENSQHIADWYSPTHVVHGLLFFVVLAFVAGALPVGMRALIAIGLEAIW